MKQNSYLLTSVSRTQLRSMRKSKGFSAENVSVEIGKSKAWLGQIERGKLLSIKKDDLIKLLLIYTNYDKDIISSNGILENFIQSGCIINLDRITKDKLVAIAERNLRRSKMSYHNNYNRSGITAEERENLLSNLKYNQIVYDMILNL